MNQHSEDYKEARHWLGMGTFVVVSTIVVAVLIGVAWVAATTLFSNASGAAGAIRQNNSTGNRIAQQAAFEDIANDYTGLLLKIKIARAALVGATGVDKTIAQTNLEGVQQACVDDAQTFNADSAKYLARDWKSAGLPARLDANACT